MKIEEALEIIKKSGLIVEHIDPDDIWSVSGSVRTKEPEEMQNLLKLKEYYPDMKASKQQYPRPTQYEFRLGEKCSAWFEYVARNKNIRFYVNWFDDKGPRSEFTRFKLSFLDRDAATMKKQIDKFINGLGVNE